MQIDDAEDADDLRAVFGMDESAELLLSTGFRKPICQLIIEDKECLRSVLLDYHCLLKVKAEMDQFAEGLMSLGVLEMMKRYPELLSPLFVDAGSPPLSPGICIDLRRSSFTAPALFILAAVEEFKDLLVVNFSDRGSSFYHLEQQAWVHFIDFLDECDGV